MISKEGEDEIANGENRIKIKIWEASCPTHSVLSVLFFDNLELESRFEASAREIMIHPLLSLSLSLTPDYKAL